MFGVSANMAMADIVMMETDVPADQHAELHRLLGSMREGARLLSYLDLRRIWGGVGVANGGVVDQSGTSLPLPLGFRQLESNRHLSDRYPTSWSVQRGHHFYFWMKVSRGVLLHFIHLSSLIYRICVIMITDGE